MQQANQLVLESKSTSTRPSLSLYHLRGSCTGHFFLDWALGTERGKPLRTAVLVLPWVRQCIFWKNTKAFMCKDCHMLHSCTSENAARSGSPSPSTSVQSHLSKLLPRGETLLHSWDQMMTCSGKVALEQRKRMDQPLLKLWQYTVLEGESARQTKTARWEQVNAYFAADKLISI